MESEEFDEEDKDDEDDDDNEISPAEYSPKSEFSKPKLVELAMQRCVQLRSLELKKGYYNYKLGKDGAVMKIWIPDSRKSYISSIDALKAILAPEIERDEEFKGKEKKIKEKIKELFEKHAYVEKALSIKEKRLVWTETGYKYLPETDDKIIMQDPKNPSKAIEGTWNSHIDQYWNELVKIYDKYLEDTNILIDRLNYFKMKMSF